MLGFLTMLLSTLIFVTTLMRYQSFCLSMYLFYFQHLYRYLLREIQFAWENYWNDILRLGF